VLHRLRESRDPDRRDTETVARYCQAWGDGTKAGDAAPVSPGDKVSEPDLPWPSSEEGQRRSDFRRGSAQSHRDPAKQQVQKGRPESQDMGGVLGAVVGVELTLAQMRK
jgi:hypothetical protein